MFGLSRHSRRIARLILSLITAASLIGGLAEPVHAMPLTRHSQDGEVDQREARQDVRRSSLRVSPGPGGAANFARDIDGIRRQLGVAYRVDSDGRQDHAIPPGRRGALLIDVEGDASRLTLVVRRSDVYVMGYLQGTQVTWLGDNAWRAQPENARFYADVRAQFVQDGYTYADDRHPLQMLYAENSGREINLLDFSQRVGRLARPDVEQRVRQNDLYELAIVVAESLRFREISLSVKADLQQSDSFRVTPFLASLITSWARTSRFIQQSSADPSPGTIDVGGAVITLARALSMVALLSVNPTQRQCRAPHVKARDDAELRVESVMDLPESRDGNPRVLWQKGGFAAGISLDDQLVDTLVEPPAAIGGRWPHLIGTPLVDGFDAGASIPGTNTSLVFECDEVTTVSWTDGVPRVIGAPQKLTDRFPSLTQPAGAWDPSWRVDAAVISAIPDQPAEYALALFTAGGVAPDGTPLPGRVTTVGFSTESSVTQFIDQTFIEDLFLNSRDTDFRLGVDAAFPVRSGGVTRLYLVKGDRYQLYEFKGWHKSIFQQSGQTDHVFCSLATTMFGSQLPQRAVKAGAYALSAEPTDHERFSDGVEGTVRVARLEADRVPMHLEPGDSFVYQFTLPVGLTAKALPAATPDDDLVDTWSKYDFDSRGTQIITLKSTARRALEEVAPKTYSFEVVAGSELQDGGRVSVSAGLPSGFFSLADRASETVSVGIPLAQGTHDLSATTPSKLFRPGASGVLEFATLPRGMESEYVNMDRGDRIVQIVDLPDHLEVSSLPEVEAAYDYISTWTKGLHDGHWRVVHETSFTKSAKMLARRSFTVPVRASGTIKYGSLIESEMQIPSRFYSTARTARVTVPAPGEPTTFGVDHVATAALTGTGLPGDEVLVSYELEAKGGSGLALQPGEQVVHTVDLGKALRSPRLPADTATTESSMAWSKALVNGATVVVGTYTQKRPGRPYRHDAGFAATAAPGIRNGSVIRVRVKLPPRLESSRTSGQTAITAYGEKILTCSASGHTGYARVRYWWDTAGALAAKTTAYRITGGDSSRNSANLDLRVMLTQSDWAQAWGWFTSGDDLKQDGQWHTMQPEVATRQVLKNPRQTGRATITERFTFDEWGADPECSTSLSVDTRWATT